MPTVREILSASEQVVSGLKTRAKSPVPIEITVLLRREDIKRHRINEMPWLGKQGLRQLMEQAARMHVERFVFVGEGLEHDPQEYDYLENAADLAHNLGMRVAVVTYGTTIRTEDGKFDRVEILVPALDVEGWHEQMGGEPVTDGRRRWFYPWDHDPNPDGELVWRLCGALAEAGEEDLEGIEEVLENFDGPAEDHLFSVRETNFDKCYLQWLYPLIEPGGDVKPCPAAIDARPLGSLANLPFKDLWRERNEMALPHCPLIKEGKPCAYPVAQQCCHELAGKGASS